MKIVADMVLCMTATALAFVGFYYATGGNWRQTAGCYSLAFFLCPNPYLVAADRSLGKAKST